MGHVLVRESLMLGHELAAVVSVYSGLTLVDLRNETIEPDAISLLPLSIARRYHVLPLRQRDSRLVLAVADPTDSKVMHDVSVRTGRMLEPVIAEFEDIRDHLEVSYRMAERLTAQTEEATQPVERKVGRDAGSGTQPSDVISLLLYQALQDRASDIHIEPSRSRLGVRFRIDGILHEVMTLPLSLHLPLISRLKVMSGMNIAERRRPQDGQFNFEASDRTVDVRVSFSNTVSGEMAVLRLLDNRRLTLLSLDRLGMSGYVLTEYSRLLRLPHGVIIVCGPTGSGKSTSLYASILQMDRTELNVVSIEDPVEYNIPNTNQMQVHAEVGVTFATQLRSILRLDPDVILVGEIRDRETATIATQAALTGHLVLTSLHANDSVGALLRLRDLGVPPYLIVSSVGGIVAQRMVRVVCKYCQARAAPSAGEVEAYASELGEGRSEFTYGRGCNLCARTGYHGRTGVFELLTMTDRIKQLFLEDAPRDALWKQALQDGLVPMRRDGMLKVKEGKTTPYEVMRVLFTL